MMLSRWLVTTTRLQELGMKDGKLDMACKRLLRSCTMDRYMYDWPS